MSGQVSIHVYRQTMEEDVYKVDEQSQEHVYETGDRPKNPGSFPHSVLELTLDRGLFVPVSRSVVLSLVGTTG